MGAVTIRCRVVGGWLWCPRPNPLLLATLAARQGKPQLFACVGPTPDASTAVCHSLLFSKIAINLQKQKTRRDQGSSRRRYVLLLAVGEGSRGSEYLGAG